MDVRKVHYWEETSRGFVTPTAHVVMDAHCILLHEVNPDSVESTLLAVTDDAL